MMDTLNVRSNQCSSTIDISVFTSSNGEKEEERDPSGKEELLIPANGGEA